jgi:branched-chain amino acid transport system permease protein
MIPQPLGQYLADGVLNGAVIGLGAIGLTLTYAVLRFANFVQGELLTCGAYLALVAAAALAPLLGAGSFGALTFGWPLLAATLIAAPLTGLLAVALDWVLFRLLRRRGSAIGMVIASFGASLALRSFLEFGFGGSPRAYGTDIAFAIRVAGIRATPDQLAALALMLALMVATHLLMAHSPLGRRMRAVAENADLARLCGVDVAAVVRATWMLGGALAAVAGVVLGVLAQLRPYMGFDLLLPLFAAAILGGIGSVPGAMLGGLIVGVGEALAVPLLGAEYRAAMAFLLLLATLLLRPTGLFGARA